MSVLAPGEEWPNITASESSVHDDTFQKQTTNSSMSSPTNQLIPSLCNFTNYKKDPAKAGQELQNI